MAKLIVAINIDHNEARKIEAQAKERHKVELNDDGVPDGYFNPDGRIALHEAELETDSFDDAFVVFEYRGIEYE
jgi:hypothetical protein